MRKLFVTKSQTIYQPTYLASNVYKHFNEKMTSTVLWRMLLDSGYLTPDLIPDPNDPEEVQPTGVRSSEIRAKFLSTPEKASTISNSFGGGDTSDNALWIYQLSPEGKDENGLINATEAWQIWNPIITKISWGDLDYGDDNLVEYTLDVTYDWARHYDQNPNKTANDFLISLDNVINE